MRICLRETASRSAVGLMVCALAIAAPVSAQGAATIYAQEATPTEPSSGALWFQPSTGALKVVTATNPLVWGAVSGGAGEGIPSGSILLIDSGACPAGYSEVPGLDGRMILGTLAAHANVGTTGGSDAITPAGTISAIDQVVNHTHTVTVTDPGHTHNQGYRNSGTAGTAGIQGASTANNATIANAVPSGVTGITASSATPAGGVASMTPTFTGTAGDNRSAFLRMIACRKS